MASTNTTNTPVRNTRFPRTRTADKQNHTPSLLKKTYEGPLFIAIHLSIKSIEREWYDLMGKHVDQPEIAETESGDGGKRYKRESHERCFQGAAEGMGSIPDFGKVAIDNFGLFFTHQAAEREWEDRLHHSITRNDKPSLRLN